MIKKMRRLPREPEDRHQFSLSQEVFDYVATDNRLIFECEDKFREQIEEVVWFTAWDGNKEYMKNFIKEHLPMSSFRWPYLELLSQSFNWSGIFPVSWLKCVYTKDMRIEISKKFQIYCLMHIGLAGRYRDFLTYRSLISFDPERWFHARVGDNYDCIISQNMCAEINKTLTRDIYDNNPETCLTMLPYCNIIIEDCSRRRPLGTEPPEWLNVAKKPLK